VKSVKKPVKFKSLSLPQPLFEEMKEYVENSNRHRNMAEFLREAIKYKLDLETATQLDKTDLLLKELDSLKKSRREIRKEIRHIVKQGTIEEKNHLKETSQALDQHMDAKLKKEEERDRKNFEYQLTHGTPYNIKEMRKNLIRKYKKQKKDIPKWLSDPEEKTIVQVSIGELETLIRKIISETPEKKEKKKTS